MRHLINSSEMAAFCSKLLPNVFKLRVKNLRDFRGREERRFNVLKSYGIVVQNLRCTRTGNDLLVRCHPLRIYTNSRKFQPLCCKYGVAGWLFSRCFFSSCIQIFKASLGLSGQIAEFSEGSLISNDKNSLLILEYLRKLRWFRNQRWITLRPWFAKIISFWI